mmetsp:Transcript_208/g.519  ORF Transcript_208/g.519 Transcript_208/m.519 type:complete len:388 (-) Transcript_208:315-1478(-)
MALRRHLLRLFHPHPIAADLPDAEFARARHLRGILRHHLVHQVPHYALHVPGVHISERMLLGSTRPHCSEDVELLHWSEHAGRRRPRHAAPAANGLPMLRGTAGIASPQLHGTARLPLRRLGAKAGYGRELPRAAVVLPTLERLPGGARGEVRLGAEAIRDARRHAKAVREDVACACKVDLFRGIVVDPRPRQNAIPDADGIALLRMRCGLDMQASSAVWAAETQVLRPGDVDEAPFRRDAAVDKHGGGGLLPEALLRGDVDDALPVKGPRPSRCRVPGLVAIRDMQALAVGVEAQPAADAERLLIGVVGPRLQRRQGLGHTLAQPHLGPNEEVRGVQARAPKVDDLPGDIGLVMASCARAAGDVGLATGPRAHGDVGLRGAVGDVF